MSPCSKTFRNGASALGLALGILCTASAAHADVRDKPLLSRATVSSLDFATLFTPPSSTTTVPASAAIPAPRLKMKGVEGNLQDGGAFLGMVPNISFVARDWSDYRLIAGSKVVATDQYRASRANRFLLARVHFDNGRFTPYAQAGLGMWRVDPDLVPMLPHDMEPAAQVGVGGEVRLGKTIQIAAEVDWTTLYREQHEPQMIAPTALFASHLAVRGTF